MLSESQEGMDNITQQMAFQLVFTRALPVTLMSDQSRALNPGAAAEKTGESNVYFCSKEQMKLFCHRDLTSAGEQCNFLLSQ